MRLFQAICIRLFGRNNYGSARYENFLMLRVGNMDAALCGEHVLESVATYNEFIDQIHLANAILDRSHSDFGDYHVPPGAPGFLTTDKIALIMDCAIKAELFGEARPGVSVEIRTADGGDPWATEALCRRVLSEAWDMYLSGVPDMKATDTRGIRR